MKKIIFAALLTLTIPTLVAAQPATGNSQIAWDQDNVSVADANNYVFKYYPDGASTGITLTGVTCSQPAAQVVCQAPFPAFTPGNHALTITASNLAGESLKSASFPFVFVVVPTAPRNLRIQ